MAEEKEKVKEKVLVVEALPTQTFNEYEKDGVRYKMVTTMDALNEILEKVREIHKSVA